MKVLVACEFSGRVRDAFAKKGHNTTSCDLLEDEGTESNVPHPKWGERLHVHGNVLDILNWGWDLIIAHPPCTYLSVAGLHWNKKIKGRQQKTEEAFEFFMQLYNAPTEKICVENPVGYVNTHFRKPDQTINPFQFGHPERKRTCLWLKNLPLLQPTNEVEPEKPVYVCKSGRPLYFVDAMSPSKDRWKLRSITFQGIADAMAEQWG